MKDCFERVMELQGKSNDDPLFARFIDDLGDTPQIYLKNKHSTEYAFNNSGMFMSYFEGPKCLALVFFHSQSKPGFVHYQDNFPKGVAFGDTRDVVEGKLELKPVSSEIAHGDVWDEFEIQDMLLGFCFCESTGKLHKVTARYVPAWDLVNGRPKRTRET